MGSRTLGNSSHALRNKLHESHNTHHMKLSFEYMDACEKCSQQISFQKKDLTFTLFPSYRVLPTAQWLLLTCVNDAWARLDSCKSQITSTFADILKIDSTKKILRKLSGKVRHTASWVTNVSNSYGGILQCVLTSAESNEGLEPMPRVCRKGILKPT